MSERPNGPTPEELIGEAATQDELPSDLSGTVIRGAGLAGAGYFLAQALNLGFYLALARLADPSDFGEFAAASLVIGVSLLVTESGMMSALIHRRDRVEESANTALVATAIAGFAFSLVALALAPLQGVFFDSSTIAALAAALSGNIFIRTLSTVPDALLQRRFSFLRRIVIEPISVVAFGVAAVIGTANGLGAWGLVIGTYAFSVTDLILAWGFARWRPNLRLASFGLWRELVGYGRHILLATAILRVGEQADTLWLGRFLGTAPLGQYRYGFRLASTSYLSLVAGASYVLFPAFARITATRDRFEAAFMRSLRWMTMVAFPAGLGLLALGVPLATILFGDVWHRAGEIATAMCLYPAMSAMSSLASEALKADGRPDLLTRMHTLTTVLGAILMGALLAPFGVIGVAAALSIAATVSGAYALSLVHRVLGFSVRSMVEEMWPSAVAAAVMGACILALDRLVIHAASHSAAVGVVCLVGETLAGAAIVLAVTALVAPARIGELRRGVASVLARVRGR